MCVIIYKPAEETIEDAVLERMWTRNPDGGGFAFFDRGRLQVTKSMDKNQFLHKLKSAMGRNRNSDFLIHMRIATHGSVCMDNTHPFWTNDDQDTLIAHNGMIDVKFSPNEVKETWSWDSDFYYSNGGYAKAKGKVPVDPQDRSDTRVFIDEYLSNLPPNWMDNPYLSHMVAEFIGHSKLVIFTVREDTEYGAYIINEGAGTWSKGVWYSNTHGLYEYKSKGTPKQTQANYKWNTSNIDMLKVAQASKRVWIPASEEHYSTFKITTSADLADIRLERFLKHRRTFLDLLNDIEYDPYEDEWYCYTCDEPVNTSPEPKESIDWGSCFCWDKYCASCEELPMDCACQVPTLRWFTDVEASEA